MLLAAGMGALACAAPPAAAGKVEVVHVFKGDHHGGKEPWGALLQASDGNLWGTTNEGGDGNDGIVFKLSLDGDFESVTGVPPGMGRGFVGDLVQTDDGTLWAVTSYGGDFDAGTILKVGLDGSVNLVYSFNPAGWGGHPTNGLTKASDGYLYGLIPDDTENRLPAVVYRIDPATLEWSVVATLPDDCAYYSGRLIAGADGALYGLRPGQDACAYRVTPRGTAKILHKYFKSRYPQSMALAGDGNFYGVMRDYLHAGHGPACPALFRMTTSGKTTVLRHFPCHDGDEFPGGVALGADGRLHGSTSHYVKGHSFFTVWSVTLDGSTFTQSRAPNFAGDIGNTPVSASDGALYEAASYGGKYEQGTIIRVTP